MTDGIYAIPRAVTSLQDCYFYHSMEIPGWGEVRGEWDLRGGEAAYLGNVDLKDKRVLELGAASGFLSFYMERQGADVVGYDPSLNVPAFTPGLAKKLLAEAGHPDGLTLTMNELPTMPAKAIQPIPRTSS